MSRGIKDRVRRQPWSALVVALLGLLLAGATAVEQGVIPNVEHVISAGASKWVVLGLTLALLVASAWFTADVRRLRRWSDRSAQLEASLTEFELQHPDALAAALETVHPVDAASRLLARLRSASGVVSDRLATPGDGPTLEQLADLEVAAVAASTPTLEQRDAGWLKRDDSVISRAWTATANVGTAARRAVVERRELGERSTLAGVDATEVGHDPQHRWSDLIGVAAIVGGLIAAPVVADGLAEDASEDESGVAAPAEIARLRERIEDLSNQLDEQRGMAEQVNDLVDAVAGWSMPETLRVELPPADPVPVVISLVSDGTDVERLTIEPGSTLWDIAVERCGGGRTSAHVRAIWDANTATLGSNPDAISADDSISIVCADPAADEAATSLSGG